jgi:hypothetical protein
MVTVREARIIKISSSAESGREESSGRYEDPDKLRTLREELLKTRRIMLGALQRLEQHVAVIDVLLQTK